jgi:large subunit ribosomal protein L18
MRRPKTRKTPLRRRKEGRTDFRLRLKLLKSGKPRLVIRKSLNNLICQVVKYNPKGDTVIVSADSRELSKMGWKHHCGNIPSAYLTGLLCGTRAKKEKLQGIVLDLGLYTSVKGSRLYACLKGALDSGGLDIPHSEEILPPEERISGRHIASFSKKSAAIEKDFQALKAKIAKK